MKFHTACATLLLSLPALSEARFSRSGKGKGKSSTSCSASETKNEAYNELSGLIFDGTCKPLDVSTLAGFLGLTKDPLDRVTSLAAALLPPL